MESIRDIWSFISVDLWIHWQGIMFGVVVTILAQTLKASVLTKEMARDYKVVFWLRRLFPVLILFFGVIAGLVLPGEVAPGVITRAQKVLYFMSFAGGMIVLYNVTRTYLKKKYDLDISVPTLSEIPPEPKKP